MSPAPGVQITTSVARRRTQTGVIPDTLFVPAITQKGPHASAVEVSSIAEFEAVYGAPVSSGIAHAAIRTAFAERGTPRVFVGRIVGPGAVKASKAFSTAALTVTAKEYGAYWNAATVQIATGGTSVITIVEPDGTIITSPALADLAAVAAWGADLDHFDFATSGAVLPATAAATPLAGGTDDAASITETQRDTARALFGKSLGCGIIQEPGSTTTAAGLKLMAHAAANNRLAMIDIAEGNSTGQAETFESALRNQTGASRSKLNRSWARVRSTTPGAADLVPFSILEAGMLGRNTAAGVPMGQPAAGGFGMPSGALSLETEFSDADRSALNDSRVNVAISQDGQIMGYGNRSLSTAAGETQFSIARTLMVIEAESEQAGRAYVHRLVDGEGHVLASFLKDLVAICEKHRLDGSLFGSSSTAYVVQVFEVNTDANLLEGVLNAAIDVLPAGASEYVRINITAHAEAIGA